LCASSGRAYAPLRPSTPLRYGRNFSLHQPFFSFPQLRTQTAPYAPFRSGAPLRSGCLRRVKSRSGRSPPGAPLSTLRARAFVTTQLLGQPQSLLPRAAPSAPFATPPAGSLAPCTRTLHYVPLKKCMATLHSTPLRAQLLVTPALFLFPPGLALKQRPTLRSVPLRPPARLVPPTPSGSRAIYLLAWSSAPVVRVPPGSLRSVPLRARAHGTAGFSLLPPGTR
jgi:hypothetical protein